MPQMVEGIKMKSNALLDARATTLIIAWTLDFIIDLNKPFWSSKSHPKEMLKKKLPSS
jgi:hypothetical protein